MAYGNNLLTVTVVASLSHATRQYMAVNFHGNLAGCNGAFLGICQNKPAAGEHMTVGFAGITKAKAGAAITVGKPLAVTSTGFFTSVASGAAVGRALTAASSGATFTAQLFGGVCICASEFA